MPVTISAALQNALPQIGKKFINQNVAETSLIRYFPNFEEGVTRGTYKTGIIQSLVAQFGDCCSCPDGTLNIADVDFKAECVKLGFDVCASQLNAFVRRLMPMASYRVDKLDADWEGIITEAVAIAMNKQLNALLLFGDTTSSDKNLAPIDGLIKLIKAGGGAKTTITGDNAKDVVDNAMAALRAKMLGTPWFSQRVLGFISPSLNMRLTDIFQPSPNCCTGSGTPNAPEKEPLDPTEYGFATLIPVQALEATQDILLVPQDNVVGGVSSYADFEQINLYEKCGDNWNFSTGGTIGLGLADATIAVYGGVTATQVNGKYCACVQATNVAPAA